MSIYIHLCAVPQLHFILQFTTKSCSAMDSATYTLQHYSDELCSSEGLIFIITYFPPFVENQTSWGVIFILNKIVYKNGGTIKCRRWFFSLFSGPLKFDLAKSELLACCLLHLHFIAIIAHLCLHKPLTYSILFLNALIWIEENGELESADGTPCFHSRLRDPRHEWDHLRACKEC